VEEHVIRGHVFAAICYMEAWMLDVVRGFTGFSREERRTISEDFARYLCHGSCYCGLPRCPKQHSMAVQPASGLGLGLFVRRAVIGPTGLQANSIAGGMLYRLVLQPEMGMLVDFVELKRCSEPACQARYELVNCPRCGRAFNPTTIEVIGEPRLFLCGVYVPVWRWRCGPASHPHYYEQRLCRTHTEEHPVVRSYTVHDASGQCDHCPWIDCPQGRPRHPQRGTELWIR
jgi:hypothetical protein